MTTSLCCEAQGGFFMQQSWFYYINISILSFQITVF